MMEILVTINVFSLKEQPKDLCDRNKLALTDTECLSQTYNFCDRLGFSFTDMNCLKMYMNVKKHSITLFL